MSNAAVVPAMKSVYERCEDRALLTLTSSSTATSTVQPANQPEHPDSQCRTGTDRAANHAVQISTPKIETAARLVRVARQIESLSHGSPIGIEGFSSAGPWWRRAVRSQVAS